MERYECGYEELDHAVAKASNEIRYWHQLMKYHHSERLRICLDFLRDFIEEYEHA
ncbi:hypothetical protein Q2941_25360 [Bradyrhizobium sp. UFLA05-153]